MIRPNLLIHWTGRDIATAPNGLSDKDRGKYVERLMDILVNGFWMTCPEEQLAGCHTRAQSGSGSVSFKYRTYMTCFTEVKLSQSLEHAKLYGLLGIAVDRKYVLDRWGLPVHYVRNHKDERIVGEFFELRYLINEQKDKMVEDAARIDEIIRYIGTFFKAMSQKGKDDFKFFDEHEWRVVMTKEQIHKGKIIQISQEPYYRLLLQPEDIKLVVFPDTQTRENALQKKKFIQIIDRKIFPMLTIEECQQF